jgi:CheY-like chemotaxis protein
MNMKRILVADDEDNVRFILRKNLETEGYEVLGANDGSIPKAT